MYSYALLKEQHVTNLFVYGMLNTNEKLAIFVAFSKFAIHSKRKISHP